MKFTDSDESDSQDADVHHAAGGYYVSPIPRSRRNLSESGFRQLKRQHEEDMDRKGYASEILFKGMIDEIIRWEKVEGLLSIRRATRNQDLAHKVDYWLEVRLVNGIKYPIAIQVKSSWISAETFKFKYGKKFVHIYIVVMNTQMNEQKLLDRIRYIITYEQQRLNIRPASS